MKLINSARFTAVLDADVLYPVVIMPIALTHFFNSEEFFFNLFFDTYNNSTLRRNHKMIIDASNKLAFQNVSNTILSAPFIDVQIVKDKLAIWDLVKA